MLRLLCHDINRLTSTSLMRYCPAKALHYGLHLKGDASGCFPVSRMLMGMLQIAAAASCAPAERSAPSARLRPSTSPARSRPVWSGHSSAVLSTAVRLPFSRHHATQTQAHSTKDWCSGPVDQEERLATVHFKVLIS